jgi:hypothetical protein
MYPLGDEGYHAIRENRSLTERWLIPKNYQGGNIQLVDAQKLRVITYDSLDADLVLIGVQGLHMRF